MRSFSMRIPVVAALFAAITALTCASPAAGANTSRKGAEYFTNVELITQSGAKVHFYDDLLKGKIVVIELFYAHCTNSCPLETARLAQVQRMLGDRVGKDVFFYSISLDPGRDTPELMKSFAEKYKAGPGWFFLTGKKEDIDLLSKRLGMYSDFNVDNPEGGHPASVLLGNEATGQWIRNSAFDNPRFLAVMIGDWMNSWKSAPNAAKTYTDAPKISITDPGEYTFATHCAACHSIGQGDKIGPDLLGVTNRRDPAWLKRFIATPQELIAEKDPIATALYAKHKQVNMPDLRLNETDVSALIHYLETRAAKQP
jgi:protein SCO1